jgi:signal peptidase II
LNSKKLLALFAPVVIVLIIDQVTKWVVRTTPALHNKTLIDGWLQFYFTKNPGMALGIEVLSTPVISVIAILAVTGILIYILRQINEVNFGYLICMGLILGGAFGNIADRLFMARIMDYGGVLEGHVVDFIYFSLKIGDWTIFPYIFNVADIAISTAIILLVLFNKQLFAHPDDDEYEDSEEVFIENDIEADSATPAQQ